VAAWLTQRKAPNNGAGSAAFVSPTSGVMTAASAVSSLKTTRLSIISAGADDGSLEFDHDWSASCLEMLAFATPIV
jgi:hypothetical protein